MLIAIGYCSKDLDQAIRLAEWMEELGPYPNHSILVARDVSTRAQPFAEIGFATRVEEFVITDDVWSSWPQSANNVFKKVCKHIEYTRPEPWLWLEPDCVPMRAGWLDEIAAEYQKALAAGKVFLNDFVSVHTPELDVPDHGSGVGVYPGMMTHHAGEAVLALETAWDVFAREQILPRMQTSELIMHSWKHGAFADWEQVEREIFAFKSRCVLFHADKSGSLFSLLRAERNKNSASADPGQVDAPSVSLGQRDATGNIAGSTATAIGKSCDILIKSYPPDYELLKYCLRSVDRFASGFRRIVLITPKGALGDDSWRSWWDGTLKTPLYAIEVDETGDGYLFQQAVKINAHEYTPADYILHIDSDTLLTKPVTPETFFRDGKVLWLMTPYDQTETPWKPITEKFLGEPVEFEFMRRFPLLVPRSLHVSADVFCRVRHKMSLTQYILSQTNKEFSEFNALGALSYRNHRKEFSWLDTSKEPLPEAVALQRWSHDPLTSEVKEQLEQILKGGDVECVSSVLSSPNKSANSDAAPTSDPSGAAFIETIGKELSRMIAEKKANEAWGGTPEQLLQDFRDYYASITQPRARSENSEEKPLVPWADRDASLEHIKMLAAELKLFCTAPAYVRQVREELKAARVIR